MSENSELIHWHLQPRSVALLVTLRGEEGPVVANSVLPHLQQQSCCHCLWKPAGWEERQGLMENGRSVLLV